MRNLDVDLRDGPFLIFIIKLILIIMPHDFQSTALFTIAFYS